MSYVIKNNILRHKTSTDFFSTSCFLCNNILTEKEDSFCLFQERLYENNEKDSPISVTLSDILSQTINETSKLHSQVLCTECNHMVIDYELLAKQLSDIKTKIIKKYNYTVEIIEKNLIKLNEENMKKEQMNNEKLTFLYQYINKKEPIKLINKQINENSNFSNEALYDTNNLVDLDYTSEHEQVYVIAQNNNVPEIEIFEPKIEAQLNIESKNIVPVLPKVDTVPGVSLPPKSCFEHDPITGNFTYKDLYTCKHCSKQFTYKNLYQEHMEEHINKNQSFECPICGRKFVSKYTMKAHEIIHTARERKFVCSKCDKSFFSLPNLLAHEKTHLGVKEFKCEICGKLLSSLHNLELHNIIHTGVKPYVCKICDRSFARRAELLDHERVHTGEKPFKCDLCGIAFAQRSNLLSHKRSTHFNVKLYSCDVCNKSFKRRRLLDYHIKSVHTKERPIKCEICPADFVYPEHYKKHLKSHYGLKPFECEFCKKTFYSKENRNSHRFTHSDRKPYECVTCHQGFMRKQTLFRHMERENHQNDSIIVNNPQIDSDGSLHYENTENELNYEEIGTTEDNTDIYEEIVMA